ncbi:hypothetical protein N0V84_007362, partial [Fusarium piperis]
ILHIFTKDIGTMRSHIVYSLIAAASLLGGGMAGPCRPSSSLELSSSTTEDSQSSTSEVASSSTFFETTSSTTSDHVSTSTDVTLSTSTGDASSTTDDATSSATSEASSSTASSTELAPSSTTDSWTSTVESSTSLASATETATSTTEATTSTTELTSTTQASSSTSEGSTTTSEASSATSEAPPVTTFAIEVANSARQSVNGKKARYRRGTSGYGIYLTLGAASESLYVPGDFHIEASTNRLMVGDVYVSVGTSTSGLLVAQTAASVASVNYLFISCTPPVSLGQKLECVAEGTSRTQLYVSANEQTNTPMYITAPGSPPGIAYVTFDMVVVSP